MQLRIPCIVGRCGLLQQAHAFFDVHASGKQIVSLSYSLMICDATLGRVVPPVRRGTPMDWHQFVASRPCWACACTCWRMKADGRMFTAHAQWRKWQCASNLVPLPYKTLTSHPNSFNFPSLQRAGQPFYRTPCDLKYMLVRSSLLQRKLTFYSNSERHGLQLWHREVSQQLVRTVCNATSDHWQQQLSGSYPQK